MKPYEQFLREKRITRKSTGFDVLPEQINPIAKPHQNASIRYVLRKGKGALFHDTGLGKTLDQLEIGRLVIGHTEKPFLVVMPLNVAYETIDNINNSDHILSQLDIEAQVIRDRKDVIDPPELKVYITNYENLHKFYGVDWGGISFDESSIFKGAGKFFQKAKKIGVDKNVPFLFCASATPNPNSPEEIGLQSEVLGIMTQAQMKATFFVNRQDKKRIDLTKSITIFRDTCSDCDDELEDIGHVLWCENCDSTYSKTKDFTEISEEVSKTKSKKNTRQGWELRPHAQEKFYQWLASWAMAIKLPSDLGFDNENYEKTKLTVMPIFIEAGYKPQDRLVFTGLGGVGDRSKVRAMTLEPKCQMATELIGDSTDQWIVWCGLNPEADLMKKLLGDKAVNVQGSDKLEKKIDGLRSFASGETQVLVTKTKICGHGSNFQNCHKVIFVGLSDSWESYKQAIDRAHRYGQLHDIDVYVILAEEEREIWDNVQTKSKEAEFMTEKLIENASEYQKAELDMKASEEVAYVEDEVKTDEYHIMLGDACRRLSAIKDNSVGLSIYSPPFGNEIYVFSNIGNDLSNSVSIDDFLDHYAYIAKDLLRVTMPGRNTVVHVADVHYRKNVNGRLGVYNYSDDVIKMYEKFGWHFYGRIPIAKNPQQAASRLKVDNLKFQTIDRDTSRLMPIQPDYLLVFKKPGKNTVPILPRTRGEINNDKWIVWAGQTYVNADFASLGDIQTEDDFAEYARRLWRERNATIWYDINEGDVIKNYKGKNGQKVNQNDTKHITPLQIKPVNRMIKLWSNPGEIVLTPFMGSGTEVCEAVKLGRYGVGIELKPEYFYDLAVPNVEEAVRLTKEEDMFSFAGIEV
jgi:DNA modification methylase